METRKQRRYRYFLYMIMMFSMLGIVFVFHFGVRNETPDTFLIERGDQTRIDFKLPVSVSVRGINGSSSQENLGIKTGVQKSVSFLPGNSPYYVMEVSAFGVLPVKQVKLQTTDTKRVYVSGMPVGIYVKTMGVMVIDTAKFVGRSGQDISPAQGILQSGDYILQVNDKPATSKREVIQQIEDCNGEQYLFTILRNGEISQVAITPEMNEQGIYKVGMWIRDSAQGIGTLTFLTEDGKFAALGHGINDSDTGKLMTIEHGSIYETDILSIQRAQQHIPGQMTGLLTLDETDYLGDIEENTGIGIYGKLDQESIERDNLFDEKYSYEIAYKQDVKKGKAQILSDVTGKQELYDVEILDLYYNSSHENQGILLKVKDKRLMEYTGGIVQGMSGSPIIQNGKLIGAVTHVFVNDPTKGYGIFVENMLEEN